MFSRPFVTLWLSLFMGSLGIGMVSPLVPIFGAELGATGAWLGLTFSGFALTQIPAMPVVGRLSDRFERKAFIIAGLGLNAAAALGYLHSANFGELIAFRALSGLGSACLYPVAHAYVGDLTPKGREGLYMGVFNVSTIVGFGSGPLVGGIILDAGGIDGTFLGMFIIAVLAVGVAAFLPRASQRRSSSTTPITPLANILRSPPVLAAAAYYIAWGVRAGAAFAFMAVFLRQELDATGLQIGFVLSSASFLGGAVQLVLGRLADKYSRTLIAVIGGLAISSLMFGVAQADSFALILLLFALAGMIDSLAFTAATAMAVDAGRYLGMGSTMGVLQMAMPIGILAGSLSSGSLASTLGIRSVFVFAALAALAGAMAVAAISRRHGQR